ncbi:hypothetical protein ACUR5C_04480 [Aliikangiella sp. IMCC44653]
MNDTRWYKNPEMIVALSALLIGLVTAFTSIYSAFIDREYARASVWPRLEIFRSYSGDSFSYGVTNNGTGPALIKYAKIKSELKPISRWSDIDAFKNIRQSHLGNRTLPAQQNITPLSYRGEDIKAFLAADKNVTIELCYCSIYQECWVINRNNRPQAVGKCTIKDDEKFLQ